jgi:hypothetical protein
MCGVKVCHKKGALRGIWKRIAVELSLMDGREISAAAVRLRYARGNFVVRGLYKKEIKKIVTTGRSIAESLVTINQTQEGK